MISADFMDRLRRYIAGKTPTPQERDDILQECVARVLARVNKGVLPAAEMEPYAFRVAANLITDGYRRGQRTFVEMPEELASETAGPERIFEAREELSAVSEVIRQMPQLRRSVFQMIRVEGLSHGDVSQALGLSRKAIEKHMSRALADLVLARRKWRDGNRPGTGGGADE